MSLGPDDITPNPDGSAVDAFTIEERIVRLERKIRDLEHAFGRHKEIDFSPLEDRVDEHDRQLEALKKAMAVLASSVDRVLSAQTKIGLGVERIEKKLDRLVTK